MAVTALSRNPAPYSIPAMVWKPHVTVAAIACVRDTFLLVEEEVGGRLVLNQPAGHLEPGESLAEAAVRETREEAAWDFHPRAIVGVYRWPGQDPDATYLRVCFCGEVDGHDPEQPLDDGIQRTLWERPESLRHQADRLRSPLVTAAIDDYLRGQRYPLDLIHDIVAP